MMRRPPISTHFPCATLFRSLQRRPRLAAAPERVMGAGERGEAAAEHRAERGRGGHGAGSEEHTSELQSRQYLVCRLLLEKNEREVEDAHAALEEARARGELV